jgi:hypothetical protein
MIFTRYLYSKDEVELSLLDALLKQKSLNECYFWVYELYKSGFYHETWSLLWIIYYDFYALILPKMEKKIMREHNMWKNDKDIVHILDVVKNYLRYSKFATYEIFILRKYYSNRLLKTLDISMNNLTINSLNRKEKNKINLEHCIETQNYEGLAFYLKKMVKTDITWVVNRFNIETNVLYTDLFHQILFNLMKTDQKKKIYYKKVMNKELKKITELDKNYRYEGKYSDKSVSYIYKTLENVRLFGISDNIGCFKLDRKYLNMKEMYWNHWEYFAYRSPIWRERFDKLDIEVDNENKKIVFKNDDEEEEFYEAYNYEPDEQSKEIQEQSTHDIKKSMLNDWINETFTEKIKIKIRCIMIYR